MLSYLNQLDEQKLTDLINYVNVKRDEKEATKVIIYNEPERCDEFGNQEFFVEAWNGNFHCGSFVIQDFTMKDIHRTSSLDSELREYMAKLFGENYLQSLLDYYISLAMIECDRIRQNVQNR